VSSPRTTGAPPTWGAPLLSLLPALLAGACRSPELERTDAPTSPPLQLRLENDIGTLEEDYTHATELRWAQPLAEAPELLQDLATSAPVRALAWPFEAGDGTTTRLRYRVGHRFYTPVDVETTLPQPDDRPFASLLDAGLAVEHTRLDPDPERRRDRRASVELALGLVGPSTLGEEVQTEWHRFWELQPVGGWSDQLKDEPVLLLAGRHDWRVAHGAVSTAQEADALAHADWSLGNLRTGLDLGGTLRLGKDLPRDFGLRSLATTEGGGHLFLTGNLRVVGRDLFLDGNTWKDGPSVEAEALVAEAGLGFSVQLGPVRVRLARTLRDEEFEGQRGSRGVWTLDLAARF
jgi:hypothetical protein